MIINSKVRAHISEKALSLDWVNMSFVLSFLVLGVVGTILHYSIVQEMHWGPWLLMFFLYWFTGLGITMGYHRLFSHRSYRAHPIMEAFLLIGGAMAMQNSCLKWSADHRKHHQFTDTDRDPYNAKLGFWWSHILWIFFDKEKEKGGQKGPFWQRVFPFKSVDVLNAEFPNCRDLIQDPLIRLQHAVAMPLGLVLNLLIPLLFGLYWNCPLETVLVAGLLRIAFVHQATFAINSFAHILGHPNYSTKDSSRDSLFCAVFSFGEGYHNYHHTYPHDYRNGIRLYHFDPTKWGIRLSSWVGLARDLKKARVQQKNYFVSAGHHSQSNSASAK